MGTIELADNNVEHKRIVWHGSGTDWTVIDGWLANWDHQTSTYGGRDYVKYPGIVQCWSYTHL